MWARKLAKMASNKIVEGVFGLYLTLSIKTTTANSPPPCGKLPCVDTIHN